jgi:hypothetical protein
LPEPASPQRTLGESELLAFASLPARTMVEGPPSGNFIKSPSGVDLSLPLLGQPVQGISSAVKNPDGTITALIDNGFGLKANSGDALLKLYTLAVDFEMNPGSAQAVKIVSEICLRDPKKLAGFPIVGDFELIPGSPVNSKYPGTHFSEIAVDPSTRSERLLTGMDFDPESLVRAPDGSWWIGEEFGPFLLHFSSDGILIDKPIAIPIPSSIPSSSSDRFFRSPEHPDFFNLDSDIARIDRANLPRSKGIEGMTLSYDRSALILLIEGPLKGDRQDRLAMLEFDLSTKQFTPRSWAYQLEQPYQPERVVKRNKIGALAAYSPTEFLVVETDGGHGSGGEHGAKFKRIVRIDTERQDHSGFVSKEEFIDLMGVADPRGVSPFAQPQSGTTFTFPFDTIEALVPWGDKSFLVISDNNFPSVGSREAQLLDNTELILLTPTTGVR